MSWLKRRKYVDPIHKMYAKYFVATHIKESCLHFFDSDFVNLINSLSKDEISKSDLFLIDENHICDNTQYLTSLLKLDSLPDTRYILFFDKYLSIIHSNNSKAIKDLFSIDFIFFRGIIRYTHHICHQISQNINPITEIKEISDNYLSIIRVLFDCIKQFKSDSDIFLILQQLFESIQNNPKLIISNPKFGEFVCFVFSECLELLDLQRPFKTYELIFLFVYFIYNFLISNLSKANFLPIQYKQFKHFLTFLAANYKFIMTKFSQELQSIHQVHFRMCLNLQSNHISENYSLGKKIVSFYIESLPLSAHFLIHNSESLNLLFLLLWVLDNHSIGNHNLPIPKTPFSTSFFPAEIPHDIEITCRFFTSPPLFTIDKEIDGFYSFESLRKSLRQNVMIILDKFVELLLKINNAHYLTSVFSFLSQLISNPDISSYNSIQNPEEFIFFLGLILCYLGLQLPLTPDHFSYFLELLSPTFYSDNDNNHLLHAYYRQFIYLLFIKLFQFDGPTVIESFQKLMITCQFHIVDEILIMYLHLLHLNHLSVITHIKCHFLSAYLISINEKRTVLFQFIKKIFEYEEGRIKFLSDSNFINSIFTFLFSKETIVPVSNFLIESYSHQNNANNLMYNAFTQIVFHSNLPDSQWIEFFRFIFPVLQRIVSQNRENDFVLSEYSALFSQLLSLLLSLKLEKEKCIFAPLLNVITVFTQNRKDYRMKCLPLYNKQLDIFKKISIDSIADEIVDSIFCHIFECQHNPFEFGTKPLVIKNPNALLLLHNSTLNSSVYQQILMKIESVISSTFANQVLITESLFPDHIIRFLRKDQSCSILLHILKMIFQVNFKQQFFVVMSSLISIDKNSSKGWIHHIFSIIETLSSKNANSYPFQFIFLSGESTVISIREKLKIPLKCAMTFTIYKYPIKHCPLISFYSKNSLILFNIEINQEGELFLRTNFVKTSESNYKTIDIKLQTNVEICVSFEIQKENVTISVNSHNENLNETARVSYPIPEFNPQLFTRISLFNSAKTIKKESICCLCTYFDLQFGENSYNHICFDLSEQKSAIQNALSDFQIEGIVTSRSRTILDFLTDDSGIYLLFELIDNDPSLLIKFIDILSNSIKKKCDFENDLFTILNQSSGYYGFFKLPHFCWTNESILSLFNFTESLHNVKNKQFLLSKIWFNFLDLWLKIQNKDTQHYLFTEIFPQLFLKYSDFIKNQTSIKIYLLALQNNIFNDIIIDLINILYQYLLIGFSLKDDLALLKSFIFNSNNIELRIQLNLRIFGLYQLSDNLFLEKLNEDDQFGFFQLLFRDLNSIDRNYLTEFIHESNVNTLSEYYFTHDNSPSILCDLIILVSEFVSSKILLQFVERILNTKHFSKFITSNRKELREVLLIFIIFHSSDESTSNINDNSFLIDFYSYILSQSVGFFIPFTFIIQKASSDCKFDSSNFLRSVFLNVLSKSDSVEDINMLILYIYSFIYYLPTCDPYFYNIPLYNLMEIDTPTLFNEKEIKQMSIFEFMQLCSSPFPSNLFPLRYSLRINNKEEWLDKDLALSLINQFKNKQILNTKFQFTVNQSIFGYQIVSILFITLIKTNHLFVWETVNFFLTSDLTDHYINDIILRSSIQSVIYSLIFVQHEFRTFDPTFRLFCNRFSECFEEHSTAIASNNNLFDSFKSSEMKIIINSFGEVNRFLIMLLVNYGIVFSLVNEEYLNKLTISIKSIYTSQSVEKIDFRDYNGWIDSLCDDFQYTNDLQSRHQSNYFDSSPGNSLLFSYLFHPYGLADFSSTFTPRKELINIEEDNLIVKPILISNIYKTYQSYFIFRNGDEIIIGGFKSTLMAIKWVIKRSDKSFEFFYKNNGMMILVEFDSPLDQSIIDKFPCLSKEFILSQWQHREISNYSCLLQLNFLCGYSFNVLEKYIIFPRLYPPQKAEFETEKQIRDFSKVLPPFNPNLILRLHSRENVNSEIDENQTELIPELFSVREIFPSYSFSNQMSLLESHLISSQLSSWVKNVFQIELPSQDPEQANEINFLFHPLNNIKMKPFETIKGRFYSITDENEFVISTFHEKMLIHLKLSVQPPVDLQPTQIHTILPEKLVIFCLPKTVGVQLYSIGQGSLNQAKNPFRVNILVERIEKVGLDCFFVLSSNRKFLFYNHLNRVPTFLDGKTIMAVSSNLILNLMVFVCSDKRVFLTTIHSLLFQKYFMIKENDIKWCQIFRQGIVVFASTDSIFSYDLNGQLLATSGSSHSQNRIELLSQITIKDTEYLVVTFYTGGIFLKDPETLQNIYIIRSSNPILSFVTDYSSQFAILYDNVKTTILNY